MNRKILCAVMLMLLFAFQAEAADTGQPLRMGIIQFLSRTKDVSADQAAAIGDVLARMLTSSKRLTIIERDQMDAIAAEHQMSTSGAFTDDTALAVGKIAGCQYMLFGAVTSYQQSVSTTDIWLWGKTDYYASTTIDVRIVDVNTTKVVLSLSESGSTRQSGTKFNFYGMNNQENMDFRGLAAGAIADASSRLSYKVLYALTGESAQVLKTSKKDVTINTGAVNGAQMGGMYRVYIEGEQIRGMNDEVLGRRENNIAVVKITGVQREFSTAQLAHKQAGSIANIKRGDKIFPVSASELKKMIDNKEFPKKRPKQIKLSDEQRKFLGED